MMRTERGKLKRKKPQAMKIGEQLCAIQIYLLTYNLEIRAQICLTCRRGDGGTLRDLLYHIISYYLLRRPSSVAQGRHSIQLSEGDDVKKSITSSFFNRITFHLAVGCRTFQEINV